MQNQGMGYGQDMSYLNYLNYMNQQNQFRNNMQQQSFGNQIPGRIVPNIDVINPNEVPMDGSVSIFPKSDFTEIYVKSWNQNGTINTVVYKPILNEQVNEETSKVTLDSLNEDVKSLKIEMLERFDRLEKSNSTKQTNNRAKQEDKP